jgi:hypothetical protein
LNHVRDFLDCIRSRRLTVANPGVMCRSMNICLAADICEQLKRNLEFDLRQAEFVGDPEANRLQSRALRAPYMIWVTAKLMSPAAIPTIACWYI